jgi:flagellar biosynthesis/type III secretory pathway protein FliH
MDKLENCIEAVGDIFYKGIKEIKTTQKPRIGYEQGYHDGYIEAMKTMKETIQTIMKGLKNVQRQGRACF